MPAEKYTSKPRTDTRLPENCQWAIASIRSEYATLHATQEAVRSIERTIADANASIAEITSDNSVSIEQAANVTAGKREIISIAEKRLAKAHQDVLDAKAIGTNVWVSNIGPIKCALEAIFTARLWKRIDALVADVQGWAAPAYLVDEEDHGLRHLIYRMAHLDASLAGFPELLRTDAFASFEHREGAFETAAAFLEKHADEACAGIAFTDSVNETRRKFAARGAQVPEFDFRWIKLSAENGNIAA